MSPESKAKREDGQLMSWPKIIGIMVLTGVVTGLLLGGLGALIGLSPAAITGGVGAAMGVTGGALIGRRKALEKARKK